MQHVQLDGTFRERNYSVINIGTFLTNQTNQKLLRCLSLGHSQNPINTFGQLFGIFIAAWNIVWLQL